MQWKQSQGDQWKVFSHMSALAWCCKLRMSAFCHMAEQVKQIHARFSYSCVACKHAWRSNKCAHLRILIKTNKKKSSVSLVLGSACAVTDEVSVSVKLSRHTPTLAQSLKFLPANETEGSRNFVSLVLLEGGER